MNSSLTLPTSSNGTDTFQSYYTFLYLNLMILILCLPLNLYVVRLITTGAGSGVAPEFFALNLSVCEITACVNAVPAMLYVSTFTDSIIGPVNYIACFFSTLLGIGRPFFQCCICVERYVAVVHPITFLKYRPLRYRVIFSAIVWLIVLGVSATSAFIPERVMYYYIMLPDYLLILCMKGFCSIAVLQALRRPGPGDKCNARDTEADHKKKKAFWVITIILASMVTTYSPVLIFMFLYDYLSLSQRWDGTSMSFYLMAISGLVQPLLYLHRAGKLPRIQCCKYCSAYCPLYTLKCRVIDLT